MILYLRAKALPSPPRSLGVGVATALLALAPLASALAILAAALAAAAAASAARFSVFFASRASFLALAICLYFSVISASSCFAVLRGGSVSAAASSAAAGLFLTSGSSPVGVAAAAPGSSARGADTS